MPRNEKAPHSEGSGALRAQGMNEVLPRHDLDLLTEARNFPDGDWLVSEIGRRHQFQAAFCVPNQHGQLVPAPMAPVNISAATTEEEVFQHCTVYQFAAPFQSRGNTEHSSGTANHIGQQHQRRDRGLPSNRGNFQQVPGHVQVAEPYRFDPNNKNDFMAQGEPMFFPSPSAYESAASSHPHAPGLDKEITLSPTPIQGQNNFVSFSDASVNEWPSLQHQQPTIVMGSFASTSFTESFRDSPPSDEMHGLVSFPSQCLNTDFHGSLVAQGDSFSNQFTPAMSAQLDEHTLDDIFGHTNDSRRDSDQRQHAQNNDDDNSDEST